MFPCQPHSCYFCESVSSHVTVENLQILFFLNSLTLIEYNDIVIRSKLSSMHIEAGEVEEVKMAGVATEENGVGRSFEGVSTGQQQSRCQAGEAEWRSSEQVENGSPSTSPPYWDSDDDDGGALFFLLKIMWSPES